METQPSVTVIVEYRPTDLYPLFRWSWSSILGGTVAFILISAVGDLFFRPSSAVRDFQDRHWIVAFILVLTVLMVFGFVVFPLLRIYSMYRKSPATRQAVQMTFNSDGVHTRSALSDGKGKWSAYIRIEETRAHFHLYETAYHATFVPKRCFADHDQIVELRKLIAENFKGKWQLRRD